MNITWSILKTSVWTLRWNVLRWIPRRPYKVEQRIIELCIRSEVLTLSIFIKVPKSVEYILIYVFYYILAHWSQILINNYIFLEHKH